MNRLFKTLVLFGSFFFFMAGMSLVSANMPVDTFETAQYLVAHGAGTTVSGCAAGSGMLGGERDSIVTVTAGYLDIRLSIGPNVMSHSQDSSVTGWSKLIYDGIDNDPLTINYHGLNGFDMTYAGTLNAVNLAVEFDDLPAQIKMTFYTDEFNASSYTLALPGRILTLTPFSICLCDITPSAGVGADFTNIGAIVLEVIGTYGGTDIRLRGFGMSTTRSIGNFVWNDDNHNGIQDTGENGIPGVTVELYDANNTILKTTVTNRLGYYFFGNLAAGDYYVKFILPPDYEFTLPYQDSDNIIDSDADTTTGLSSLITLTLPDEYNDTIDAGMYVPPPPTPVPTPTPSTFDCEPRTIGYWNQQCKKQQHEDPAPYFPIIAQNSRVYNEVAKAQCRTLKANASNMFDMAVCQFLATWLNYVSGKLSSNTPVDCPLTTATTVGVAMNEIEQLILSGQDLERAKDIADGINNAWFLGCTPPPENPDLLRSNTLLKE